ncbi:MAG: TonB-dependent receptor [Saprospiraceae bacterium]|nr:TonB-dependent receptor [Saprospiraceae bacterium]
MLCTVGLSAQNVSGTIKDNGGSPIVGASVLVKGTNNGTIADGNGAFTLNNVAKGSTLVVSFVGFKTREISADGSLAITLNEGDALDEVVVTGVFDKRSALSSSIAISSLGTKQIDRIVPVSAADLLKNVPGIYVNSSLGEIRNTVNARGVTTGRNNGSSGYDYVSMQEDGLPVVNALMGDFSPDMFTRVDATLGKLEAVRGGSASITGANAPGGIFNYISKTGGDKLEGEVRARFGLEGNGKNPYYRGDFNIGGPLSKNLTYNVGGFYRQSNGAQYPGYAANYGGQVKGNLLYKYGTGSLKLLVKVLDDHNLTAEGIPTTNYTDMKPATGFDNTSSVLPPAISVTTPLLDRGNLTYNPSDLWHSKDKSVGLNWEQNLGETGWKLTNNMRYSSKSNEAFTPLTVVTPINMENIVTYFILGSLHPPTQIIPGTYDISVGGKSIMTVKSFSGFDYRVVANTAPGSAIAPNSLFFTPLIYQNRKANEFLDQFNFSKRTKNMTFNIGGFIGITKYDGLQGSQGVALTTIQNRPQPVNIKVTYGNPNPTDPKNGTVYQVTNPNGVVNVGADQGYAVEAINQNQKALFFAHTWEINNQLTFDWGARYENININGVNNARAIGPVGTGGLDNNPLTLYDNSNSVLGAAFKYDKTLSYVSYSGALNYKISDNMAIYGRYSNGKKAPGFQVYQNVTNTFNETNLKPEIQTIQQFEMGFKARTEHISTNITPFYSSLEKIPTAVTFTDTKGALYNPPVLYNNLKTYGVEIDGTYKISDNFGIRGVVTLQGSNAATYKSWVHLPTGSASTPDSLIDNSGNGIAHLPNVMANITPEYSNDKFYAGLTWSYMGKRQANFANSFQLPAFGQFNLSMSYNITPKFSLSANVNNLLNQYGVMGWVGPGTFPDNLNLEGLSKEAIAANPNAFHQSFAIPARAYFLTATYKF